MSYFLIVTVRKCWILFLFVSAMFLAATFASSPSDIHDKNSISELSEDTLQATIKDITNLLGRGKSSSGSGGGGGGGDDSMMMSVAATSLNEIKETMGGLFKTMKRLELLEEKLVEKESKVNSLLEKANTRELDDLIDRLMETLEWETDLREMEQEHLLERNNVSAADDVDHNDDDLSIIVTNDTLHERLETDVIMKDSEIEMRKWVLSLIEEELDAYKEEISNYVPIDIGSSDYDTDGDTETDDANCLSTTSIVQKVQQALQNYADDGIGKVDHAQGANIVHSMTSETYLPDYSNKSSLGSVWWSKFIPQDWERLLPSDWEKWNVGIPSYIYHSLGFLSGDLAPPEAMIHKKTLPGSCWPMEGQIGQVTLKLSYPVVIESVSIDHISSDIIPEGKINSAPKHIKIVGYPPCDDSSDCAAIGFDINDPIDIAEIHYNVEGPSVQTFDSHYTKAIASLPSPATAAAAFGDNGDDNDEENDLGSCSQETASCSGPPRKIVVAVAVKILENWGNPDFTCLYRLRLHGDPHIF